MAALVVFEGEGAAVLAPHQIGQVVGIREQPRVDGDLLLAADVEEHRLFEIELIARLGVLRGPMFRLQLIFW